MACHTPPSQKSEETRGNAITQPRSHPIKNVEFREPVMVDMDKYRLVGIPPSGLEPPDVGLTKIY